MEHGIFAASKEVHFLKVLLQCETNLELSKLLLSDKRALATARRFGYVKSIRQTPTTPIQEAQAAPLCPRRLRPCSPSPPLKRSARHLDGHDARRG